MRLVKRKSGVLYPIQSFFKRNKYDIFIGDWGNFEVIDVIKRMGFKVLQILPINPICRISGSPYSGNSAFGFEYAFISVDKMIQEGLIEDKEVQDIIENFLNDGIKDYSKIYYGYAFEFKRRVLEVAFKKNFSLLKSELDKFISYNSWCINFAVYNVLKEFHNFKPWYEWPEEYRNYSPNLVKKMSQQASDRFYFYVFTQFLCWDQYMEFKRYANDRGILIFGDIPIYVAHDSVDVWANREFFKVREDGCPEFVAGVPPDYFSSTGQLWGNPVYNWDALQKQNFKWWVERLSFCFKIYDWVRIDHFRGLVAFWQIPFGSEDATTGSWQEAKPYEFFDTLLDYFSVLPIVAEDLGVITPDVDKFRDHYGIAGMRVLQFAFSDPSNIHLPHNYSSNTVAYTGTHDNNTTKGWFRKENVNLDFLSSYLGRKDMNEDNISDIFIELLLGSVANLVIIPLQDLLNLDENYRMNTPGTSENNWIYRDDLLISKLENLASKYYNLNKVYKR
ncbi:MAG: 4-alpha-glucanotransferase [bacterium]